MISSALEYHRTTGYRRGRMQPHFLDWGNPPRRHKAYPVLPRYPLDATGSCPRKNVWELLAAPDHAATQTRLDLATLSDVIRLAYTITGRRQMGRQTMTYRSVPSAGALYPTEMYVAAHQIQGLGHGVFYYDIHSFSLLKLRCGNFASHVAAVLQGLAPDHAAASIVLSGIFFRSAWKYRTRAFRYVLLDIGHLLENIVLALKLLELGHRVTYDFDDDRLHRLIGLDGKREAGFVGIQIYGRADSPQPALRKAAGEPEALAAGVLDASRVSARERDDETIATVYRLGSMVRDEASGRSPTQATNRQFSDGFAIDVSAEPEPALPYDVSLLKRRSTRAYRAEPYPRRKLMQLLALMCRPVTDQAAWDNTGPPGVAIGFLAGDVSDVAPGFYRLDRAGRRCHLVKPGNLNARMAAVCLDQGWLRQAPLHFVFTCDLVRLEDRFGPRGYRYALLAAGRMGQRLYLGATAVGDGCCGIGALYDREARDLLGLDDGSYLLYLVAVGEKKR